MLQALQLARIGEKGDVGSTRVLKRGDCASLAALEQRIRDFIAYFNQTAAPFKWTYKGRPLCR